MFKVCLVLALTVASLVAAQEPTANQPEAAPEPYSYGYQTDTHAAQEQREPNGRVTGSYQLVGDDGRERRVEYVADENGYRAKVTTNEVGTKSENSADVEVNASEPTPGQFVQYVRQQQQQVVAPVVPQQQQITQFTGVQQPAGYRQVTSSSSTALKSQLLPFGGQQTANYGYGYYPGYGYGNQQLNSGYYGYNSAAGYGNAGYGNGYGYRYASASPQVYTTTTRTATTGAPGAYYGNYNYHTPGQYYAAVGQQVPVAAGQYASAQGYRYVSQPAGVTTSSVRTVGVPATVGYTVQPATSNLSGSSNYLVLQKRAAEENKAKSS